MALPLTKEEEEMKTIEQRLQSRISKRRNVIREVEEDVAMLVTNKRTLRELGFTGLSHPAIYELSDNISQGKAFIKELADDQRLDKQLKLVVGESQWIDRQIAKGYRLVKPNFYANY